MNKHTCFPLLRRLTAFSLAVALMIPAAYAAAGEKKLQTTQTLVQGLEYRNTVTVNNDSRIESFSLELAPDSAAYPILLQGSGTIYGTASINRAVTAAQEQGYQVLAAINTDYFSTASGVPMGIVVEDGVYKSSPGNEPAMVIRDGVVSLTRDPRVELTLTNQRTDATVTPHHLNKWRSATGGLYLLNRDFSTVSTRTSTDGWYVRLRVVPQPGEDTALTVNTALTLQVTELLQSSYPLDIGPEDYILTADHQSGYLHVFEGFELGDQITLTTATPNLALANAQWAGGTGDVIIQDGAITNSSAWIHVSEGRAPRTALGQRSDGTLILYAADGRQAGYSMGLSQRDLAEELLAQGCVWAVNLDGGGSTAMNAWIPGKSAPALVSKPSDGTLRGCATYLLLVTDQKGSKQPQRLALKEDGLVVLSGTSVTLGDVAVLDDGLGVLSQSPAAVTYSSQAGLGQIEGNRYTALNTAGTDLIRLRSDALGIEGTAQVHVVSGLTSLRISRQGSSSILSSLTLKPGESVQMAVTGSYWSRTALRDWTAVTWTTTGGIGTVDAQGKFTASEQGGTGQLIATAGGISQTISVSISSLHSDVPSGHWAYDAVEYCYQNGIVGGVSATEFGRDLQIRRGDFMLMLYRAAGSPATTGNAEFTDVSSTDYFHTALAWGQKAGLASGTGDGAYSPNAFVTREQAFTILRQAMPLLGKLCPDGNLDALAQFSDSQLIAEYAKGHTATLVAQGVVSGKGTGIDPRGNLTRAEMAALLYKLITYTPILDPQAPDPTIPDPTIPDPSDPTQQTTATVTGAELGLNVRSGPGTEYPVIGRLNNGAQVSVFSQQGSWCHVAYLDDNQQIAAGFVSTTYLIFEQ